MVLEPELKDLEFDHDCDVGNEHKDVGLGTDCGICLCGMARLVTVKGWKNLAVAG